jgi:hypothetical protein
MWLVSVKARQTSRNRVLGCAGEFGNADWKSKPSMTKSGEMLSNNTSKLRRNFMATTNEAKERIAALVTQHMPSEAQGELIEMCNEIGSIQAANFLVETLATIQDASMSAEVRADEAGELACAAYNSVQNLVDSHDQWQEEEMQPLLDQISEETVSTQEMILGLMKHLGVSLEDVVKAVRANAASANEPEKYNATVGNDYAATNRKANSGNGARNPTSSLGDSTGYVKEESYQVGHRRALLPGF